MAIARYTLAVDRRGQRSENGQQADFIRCIAFDRAAEFAEKYLRQGQRILIEGHIQTGNYQDRDGKTVYTTDVLIESQEFADSKNDRNGPSYQTQSRQQPSTVGYDGFMNLPDGIDDECLPFN